VQRDAGPLVTVDDSVAGTSANQFNYVGNWGHCNPCTTPSTPPLYNNTNSWAGGGDAGVVDYVTFGFAGTEIHLYGVADPRSGVGAVSVDGGTETKVDFYTAVRAGNKLLYSSPTLAPGTHTLKLRVDATKNANSTGFTIAVDRVELR
jgi:hypothetical protein